MLNLIFAKITKGNLKLIIIVIISSLFLRTHMQWQGRQTRQNSGGVADLTKGGLQKILDFYAIKISTF